MSHQTEARAAAVLANSMAAHLEGHPESRVVLALAMLFGQFPTHAGAADPDAMLEAMVALARQQMKTRLLARQMHAAGLGSLAPMGPL